MDDLVAISGPEVSAVTEGREISRGELLVVTEVSQNAKREKSLLSTEVPADIRGIQRLEYTSYDFKSGEIEDREVGLPDVGFHDRQKMSGLKVSVPVDHLERQLLEDPTKPVYGKRLPKGWPTNAFGNRVRTLATWVSPQTCQLVLGIVPCVQRIGAIGRFRFGDVRAAR